MYTLNKGDPLFKAQNVLLVFLAIGMAFSMYAVGRGVLNAYAPEKREEQVKYAEKNYSFLKSPEKKFSSRFEDRKRRVVFVTKDNDSFKLVDNKVLEDQNLAVLYVAQVEAKAGRQDWLDEGYRSYAFTEEELAKVKALEKAHDEKERYQALKSVRPIEAKEERHVATAGNAKEVLKGRSLLVSR